MGCGSSTVAAATTSTTTPGTHTTYLAAGNNTSPQSLDASGEAVNGHDTQASDVKSPIVSVKPPPVTGDLSAASRLLLQTWSNSGVCSSIAESLLALQELLESNSRRSEWMDDFGNYLRLIREDVASARPYCRDSYHSDRIASELRATHSTFTDALKPASFIVDLVRYPFLQETLGAHRRRLESLRSEATTATLLATAIDIRQTQELVRQITAPNQRLPNSAPQVETTTQLAVVSIDSTSSGIIDDEFSTHTGSPMLRSLFTIFGALYNAYGKLQNAINAREKAPSDSPALIKSNSLTNFLSSSSSSSSSPAVWLADFIQYLREVERELRDADSLLQSNPNPQSNSTLEPHVRGITTAVESAHLTFNQVSSRHVTSDPFSLSRFLSMLHASSDQAALSHAKVLIRNRKSAMLMALLTRMKAESAELASTAVVRLQSYLVVQEEELQAARRIARAKQTEENLKRVLMPVDCTLELQQEYQRFLPGTRQTAIQAFRAFVKLPILAQAAAQLQAMPTATSPLLVFVASPGSGKSTLSSYLSQSYSTHVVSAHFFKFDQTSRRDVSRAIRSTAWQIMQRLPQIRTFVYEALNRNGITVEPDEEQWAAASEAGSTSRRRAKNDEMMRSASLDKLHVMDLWDQLIVKPLWAMDAAKQLQAESDDGSSSVAVDSSPRLVLLFDALDESTANGRNPFVQLVSELYTGAKFALPSWVGVCVTTRPESHIMRPLQVARKSQACVIFLDAETNSDGTASSSEQQPNSDLMYFFTAAVRTFMPPIDPSHLNNATFLSGRTALVSSFLAKSVGMFLYARLMLEQLELDLRLLHRVEEIESMSEPDRLRLQGWRRIDKDATQNFPLGLNSFYLDLMERATTTNSASSTTAGTRLNLSEIRRLLGFVVCAVDPLNLLQLQSLMVYQRWQQVIERSDPLRAILRIQPPATSTDTTNSKRGTSFNSGDVVCLFHKSVREWLTSPVRLEDDREKPFAIDETNANQSMMQTTWNAIQRTEQATGDEEMTFQADIFPFNSQASPPALRVDEAVLPSLLVEASQQPTLLTYAIRHLPTHTLVQLESKVAKWREQIDSGAECDVSLLQSVCAALGAALRLLCHLQYLHMRMDHTAAVSLASGPVSHLPSHSGVSTSSQDDLIDEMAEMRNVSLSQLLKEFAVAGNILRTIRMQLTALNEVQTKQYGTLHSAATQVVSVGESLLPSFSRFLRSESPHSCPPPVKRCVFTPYLHFTDSLHRLYTYARSYPDSHPVYLQATQLCALIDEFSSAAAIEWKQAKDIALMSSDDPQLPPLPSPLLATPIRWFNKPKTISPCVSLSRVGQVTSIACCMVPRAASSNGLSAASLFDSNSTSTILVAAAQQGGTYNLYDLETLEVVVYNETGSFVSFDSRPRVKRPDIMIKDSSAEAVQLRNEEDASDPLFYLVSGWHGRWESRDLSPKRQDLVISSQVNWQAATIALRNQMQFQQPIQQRGIQQRPMVPPPALSYSSQALKHVWAPLTDRVVAIQFNSQSLDETLVCNDGIVKPFAPYDVSSRVVSACFSHDGYVLFICVEGDARVHMYDVMPGGAGRAPSKIQSLYGAHGNRPASAIATTPQDHILARGTAEGGISIWRRELDSADPTGGAPWDAWKSTWKFTDLPSAPNKSSYASDSEINSIDVSSDFLLYGRGTEVWLFSLSAGVYLYHLSGHVDRVNAVALSPDGQYAISGGGGVDQSMRVWDIANHGALQPLRAETNQGSSPSVDASASSVNSAASRAEVICSTRAVYSIVHVPNSNDWYWNGNQLEIRGFTCCHEGSNSGLVNVSLSGLAGISLLQSLCLSPTDSDILACGSEVKDLLLWSLSSRKLIRSLEPPPAWASVDRVHSVSADVASGEVISSDCVTQIRYSECGRLIFACGMFNHVHIWRTDTGQCIHSIEIPTARSDDCDPIAPQVLSFDMQLKKLNDGTSDYLLVVSRMPSVLSCFRVSVDPSVPNSVSVRALWQRELNIALPPHGCTEMRAIQLTMTPRPMVICVVSPFIVIVCAMSGQVLYVFHDNRRIEQQSDAAPQATGALDTNNTTLANYAANHIPFDGEYDQRQSLQLLCCSCGKHQIGSPPNSVASGLHLAVAHARSGLVIYELDDVLNSLASETTDSAKSEFLPIDDCRVGRTPHISCFIAWPANFQASAMKMGQHKVAPGVSPEGNCEVHAHRCVVGGIDGSLLVFDTTSQSQSASPVTTESRSYHLEVGLRSQLNHSLFHALLPV